MPSVNMVREDFNNRLEGVSAYAMAIADKVKKESMK